MENVEGKMLAIASEEVADRDGDVISIDGWDLKNFKANPVLMWLHMMDGHMLPIGRANNIGVKTVNGKKKLLFEPEFHEITEMGKTVKRMFEEGYLRTFSVGFQPKEWQKLSSDQEFPPRYKYTKQELVEISAVPIPALPSATIIDEASKKGFDMTVVKSLIKDFEKSTETKSEDVEENKEEEKPQEVEEKSIEVKQGRTLSKKNEGMLREAVGMINTVLSSMDSEGDIQMDVIDADKKQYDELNERLSKMEGQIKHLIGEVQAQRKDIKTAKKETVQEMDLKDVMKIMNKATELAITKVKALEMSQQEGGEK